MADEERPPDFGPGRTPRLGLLYGSDSARNENWDRLDSIIGAIQDQLGPPAKAAPPPESSTS